jgi:hypothetical protein
MRNRVAVLPFAVAIALGLLAHTAAAGGGDVVKSGVPFEATGKVVTKTADAVVVKTDDHGHEIAFAIDRSTVLPDDLTVGRHVRVVYRPLGSTGQAAESVAAAPPRTAASR